MTASQFGFHTTAEEVAMVLGDHIKGKTILITGVSPNSLGAEAARVAAKFGAGLVAIASRSQTKLEQVARGIKFETPTANVRTLVLDLGSFAAVRVAASEVLAYPEPLDVLINSAGIMAVDYRKTVDGHESQFGTNHLGHFLFTARIFPKLRESDAPRIINVSSYGHRYGTIRFDDPGFSEGEKYDRFEAYGQSKTANILFSRELARRGVVSFSLHPGSILTNIADTIPMDALVGLGVLDEKGEVCTDGRVSWKTLGEGASTYIFAAFDPAIVAQSGAYLEDASVNEDGAAPHASDMESAKRLWELSEQLVGEKFDVI
ncbi:hypothetical protein BOTBODRAFT_447830 [Botryobasidium botryosum FD-172 SS1]|uniref:Oxidoreductase n=1 Tax=Botryobasidium botryosum (strain FD-172 SS1) TaxID=930990 RepID=A0A067M8F9_BOTB1|nr:hypothetical protein BOTBODRAFT_447830 [Botryobasidium botryosum FD-172 SS1]